jgi:DUF917 family protein
MSIRVDELTIEAAVLGGAVLGGGGGGWIEEGRRLGRIALSRGFREILPLDALPDEALLLTVSAVGAPSAGSELLAPEDYIRTVELFKEKIGQKIDGLISSEIGAIGVVNGWVQSVALQIPVVDAPCNGRAHPLGLMGSMGLHGEKDYVSRQTAVGGSREKGNRVEAFFEGSMEDISREVREAAVRAGGIVAVARNPVSAGYVRRNGAPGAIRMAIELGNVLLKNIESGPKLTYKKIYDHLGVDFIVKGKVENVVLKREGGLDVGMVRLKTRNFSYELTFWNEYMTLEREGLRLATFPDLMMTFDSQTVGPLISAQIREGSEVVIIVVLSEQLILGAAMRDIGLLRRIEKAVGKEIIRYRK